MSAKTTIALIATIVLFILLDISTYVVSEMQQAVITEFGEPIGAPVTTAGLKAKKPWQTVHLFDKRILRWDGEPKEIPTKDKRFIFVDTTARWRVEDPLKFLLSVVNERGAKLRLDDIIDSAIRETITENFLIETVRSNNGILDVLKEEIRRERETRFEEGEIEQKESERRSELMSEVKIGRGKIIEMIREKCAPLLRNEYGIHLVDVQLKRLNYIESVQQSVFGRMVSERQKEAQRFRSEGEGQKLKILGEMDRKLKEIQSTAWKTAREIEGKADAQATKIYADAYNSDPEFYAFQKSLESYQTTIGKQSKMIITTDTDYFRHLKGD
jgi:membrane protease subunit HflC